MNRTHLIGYRTDSADSSCDVGDLIVAPALEKGLEEAWRLEDLKAKVHDLIVLESDTKGSLTLHSGQRFHFDDAFRAILHGEDSLP